MMAKHKAPPKRKTHKRKSREVVPDKPLDPYREYGESSVGNLAPIIWSEIGYDDQSPLWELVEALHAIDQLGVTNPRPDQKPLIKLLKSTGTLWDKLLADLISRYDLKTPRRAGRPRRPIYSVSDDEAALWQAYFAVQDLVRKGRDGRLSVTDAVTQVSAERNIAHSKLLDAYQGRARAMRKKK
jgi:hypothetical protein